MIETSRRSTHGGLQVLILGVSTRAAVFSARRAGFCPVAADRFRDEDLAAACECLRVDDYPAGLEGAARVFPACPWLYTGGLENHPQLVDRIADERILYGNPGRVLRAVRDPFRLAEALRSAGLPSLQVAREPPDAASETWLRKPRDSGGGQRIVFAQRTSGEPDGVRFQNVGSPRSREPRNRNVYYQQYVSGTPCSAVFVGAHGQSVLLGATQQLIGAAWTGASGFQYAGSLGPLDVRPDQRRLWDRIGHTLASRFGLQGLFGVDAVLTEEAIWVVEVNPRYTASIEVLELAGDVATMLPHVAVCQGGALPAGWPLESRQRVGKAIVYAGNPGRVPAGFDEAVGRLNQDPARPAVADIPPCGLEFAAGEPLITVLAYAPSLPAVAEALRRNVAAVRTLLSA